MYFLIFPNKKKIVQKKKSFARYTLRASRSRQTQTDCTLTTGEVSLNKRGKTTDLPFRGEGRKNIELDKLGQEIFLDCFHGNNLEFLRGPCSSFTVTAKDFNLALANQ
jgi:hypothetical protein